MKPSLFLFILCILTLCLSITPAPQVQADVPACAVNPVTTAILGDADSASYIQLLKSLAGEVPVTIEGQPGQVIYTRYAPAIASNNVRAPVIPWMLEQLNGWLQPEQIEQDGFKFNYGSILYTTRNLIATFPGTVHPEEVVILSAHFDSTSTNPYWLAPGAEDNASGTAALLEAARILRFYRFDRTIKLVWFNAEEQGLLGSASYVADHPTGNIVGVVNLDMFGFDSNSDGCFELHVGTLPASDTVGQCFAQTIQSNSLPLTFDYITSGAETGSDHSTFWNKGIGAVEVLENYSNQFLPTGCSGSDPSPFYHLTTDYTVHMNLPVTFDIARAGIATAVNLAGPVGVCYDTLPTLSFTGYFGANLVHWDASPAAQAYRLERSTSGCAGEFTPLGSTNVNEWLDADVTAGQTYAYRLRVVADASRGNCISTPVCMEYTAPDHFAFLPALFH
jgi:hypothetical protein